MTLVTDIVDLAVLTGAAREIEDPATYQLSELLPTRTIEDVEYVSRRSTISRGVAEFRSWDAETPIGSRNATTTAARVKLPPLGQKLVIGEYERILLQRAQGAVNGAMVTQVYDDTRSNILSIRARLERARGQVLTTGKFTLAGENGLMLEADFGVDPSRLNVAPAKLWSDSTSDLFGFLEALADTYAAGNEEGQRPGRFSTSRRVVNAARRNQQIIRATYGSQATEGLITPAQLNQVLTDQGLPPLTVVDTKVGGTPVFPDDKIVVTPDNPEDLGSTTFGITVEALELVGSSAVEFTLADAPGIVAVTLKDGDPARVWSKANATAMPALDNPDLLMTADVL